MAMAMDSELVTVQLQPRVIDLEVGTLTVRTKSLSVNHRGYCAGWQTEVLIDGKPIRARSLEIRIAVDEVVSAKLEYFPEAKEK